MTWINHFLISLRLGNGRLTPVGSRLPAGYNYIQAPLRPAQHITTCSIPNHFIGFVSGICLMSSAAVACVQPCRVWGGEIMRPFRVLVGLCLLVLFLRSFVQHQYSTNCTLKSKEWTWSAEFSAAPLRTLQLFKTLELSGGTLLHARVWRFEFFPVNLMRRVMIEYFWQRANS